QRHFRNNEGHIMPCHCEVAYSCVRLILVHRVFVERILHSVLGAHGSHTGFVESSAIPIHHRLHLILLDLGEVQVAGDLKVPPGIKTTWRLSKKSCAHRQRKEECNRTHGHSYSWNKASIGFAPRGSVDCPIAAVSWNSCASDMA